MSTVESVLLVVGFLVISFVIYKTKPWVRTKAAPTSSSSTTTTGGGGNNVKPN